MKYLIFVFYVFCSFNSEGQNTRDSIKTYAVQIHDLKSLSEEVYACLNDFDLIMVGEMHGTNEPANFVHGLVDLYDRKDEEVLLGVEIPLSKMQSFVSNPSDSTLLMTTFFQSENIDGRNGQAWFDLISAASKMEHVKLFFFDNFVDPSVRDSNMYEEVKTQKLNHPNAKIITLSGNLHNWLIPRRGMDKMGSYIIKDTLAFDANKIASFHHLYHEGTMLNNIGNGLELQHFSNKSNFYKGGCSLLKLYCKASICLSKTV